MTNMLKLKQIRKSRGLTQAQVAAAIGLDLTNYNKLENGHTDLTWSRMQQLAELYKIEPADIVSEHPGTRTVQVRAHVQAGLWQETSEWNEEDWYSVQVPDAPDLRPYKLYAAEARGPSMNKLYPEGTVVVFTTTIDRPEQMQIGKQYLIERERADGMREATVKTLGRDETGKYWLLPESTDPRHQTPIDLEGAEGDMVRIMGKVVWSVRREG
ncbi:XRE family transcriptional regulator [Mesorhizobium sp.]|nr:XRE family transcriptional regulator [Mesorhizobium sp.]